jgi:hypothetical protein
MKCHDFNLQCIELAKSFQAVALTLGGCGTHELAFDYVQSKLMVTTILQSYVLKSGKELISDAWLECTSDDACELALAPALVVNVETDVILHPIYGVPTCYVLRAWDASGGLLTLDKFQSAVRGAHCAQEPSNYTAADKRHYEFGTLTPEAHPISGAPCWSMHVCQLSEIMKMISGAEEDHYGGLYMLRWLALVGPHIGLQLSPAYYNAVERRLRSVG